MADDRRTTIDGDQITDRSVTKDELDATGETSGHLLTVQSDGSVDWEEKVLSSGDIYGLKLRYNSASQIYIDEGYCRSDDDTENILVSSTITVNITSSGANGLDTGSEASNTWYYVWIIKNTTSGAVAGLLSTSSSSPTLPSGYTKKRRIGSVRNDGSSDLLNFNMIGNGSVREYVYDPIWNTVLNNGTATGWTDLDCSYFVPATSRLVTLHAIVLRFTEAKTEINFQPNGSTSIGTTNIQGYIRVGGHCKCVTDSSQVIEYAVGSGDWGYAYVSGYIEEL